jgi:5-formyltetrahydrofolate cyclo-ligase
VFAGFRSARLENRRFLDDVAGGPTDPSHSMAKAPPTSSLAEDKRQLRRMMAERRAGLPAAEREACARAASARFLTLPELAGTSADAPACVSAYVAVRGELDPAAAVEALRAERATVVLPRIGSRQPPRLAFHVVTAAGELCAGPFGLTEPLATCAEVPVADIDVMLVPGLAFDASGRRLGYGGGYYDGAARELRASNGRGLLVGFAYDFQVVDACPVEAHDVAVDLVVTERRVLDARVAA